MIVRRCIFVFLLLVSVSLLLGATVNYKNITYNEKIDLIVLKSAQDKPFTGTIKHSKFELKVENGKLLPNDLILGFQDVYIEDADRIPELIFSTFVVRFKDLDIPFTGKLKVADVYDDYSFLISYKDGIKNGEFLSCYYNGTIWDKSNYKDGEKDGWCFRYDESGKPTSKTLYENGVEKETAKLD